MISVKGGGNRVRNNGDLGFRNRDMEITELKEGEALMRKSQSQP